MPFLISPWEAKVFQQNQIRTVENRIDVSASPAVVWQNIKRVSAIQPNELSHSWVRDIGFPAPVAATLSYEGLGGVRNASFTGNVVFIETVDVWEPEQRLAFSIKADAEHIPDTSLDEHVKVGGRYFDVLRGEYRLEPLSDDRVRLHLSSQHRITTDFNWYSRWWTDGIMSEMQRNILEVVKARCEREAKLN